MLICHSELVARQAKNPYFKFRHFLQIVDSSPFYERLRMTSGVFQKKSRKQLAECGLPRLVFCKARNDGLFCHCELAKVGEETTAKSKGVNFCFASLKMTTCGQNPFLF